MKRIAFPVLALAFAGGLAASAAEPAPDGPYGDFLALARCLLLARDRFAETNSLSELTQTAIDGFFAALDPYSRYLARDEAEEFERDERGELVGIGLVASEDGEGVLVNWPLPGSPAFRAGVRMGDLIERIDGVRCTDAGFDAAMDALGGPEGSWVELELLRRDGARETVRVRRAAQRVPTVQSSGFAAEGVGYVRLEQFGEGTAGELAAALARLRDSGRPLRALVLDLRENPGGLLEQAVRVAGLFLPAKTKIVSTRGRVPDEDDREYATVSDGAWLEPPLAVLVDGNSASAAEIVAAALRDAGRARLVGSRTFGKASVQSFFGIPERPGAQVVLTTAHYYTPRGELIHGRGLEPDVEVPQSADELWNATLRRIAETHPELAPPGDPEAFLSAPDAPLEAAVALLLAAPADGAEGGGGSGEAEPPPVADAGKEDDAA